MSEPISFLLLERYALGELSAEERADVELRLARSSQDRACLDGILADDAVLPALPPLPRRRKPHVFALVALAAALALVWLPREPPSRRSVSDGSKGGEIALSLLSERSGPNPRTFRDGERFKLLVTCPRWFSAPLSVVVFQDGQRYQPLPDARIQCGNGVPWPGAFSLDGAGEVQVCLSWSARSGDSARELSPDVVCAELAPE